MKMVSPTAISIGTIAVILLMTILLHAVLLPFVAGLILAYLLAPVVQRLEALGLNRRLAAAGLVGLFITGVGGVVFLATPILGSELASFIDHVPGYIGQLQAFANDPSRPWLRKIIGQGLTEAEQSAGELTSMGAQWIASFLSSIWTSSGAVLSLLSLCIVTPIVTIYLLIDWNELIATVERAIPPASRATVLALARDIDSSIGGFLHGQGTICLILAFYYALALSLAGLNHGILIGLSAGLISFVPYLGFFTGLILSVCMVVLQVGPDWALILVVVVIFFLGQSLADYGLAPYLIASRIHLNPVFVMFAIAAFGYLFGFVGLLIAVPVAAAIGVVVRSLFHEYLLLEAEGTAMKEASSVMPGVNAPSSTRR
ncbi:MAG TPA: AI-2E family transporter [Methylocella sp.]|nr:AI-2E family transporter [Methylocella sp.]